MSVIIGIDPGASGWIASIDQDGMLMCIPMPDTERDILDAFLEMIDGHKKIFVLIERVHSMPGQGVASMFKFGQGYGFLRGVLVSLELPFLEVQPGTWMKTLKVPSRGKKITKTQHKNALKQMAQQLYPKAKVTLKTADAILIAHYGYISKK